MAKKTATPKKNNSAKKAKLKRLSKEELKKFSGGAPIPTGHHGAIREY